MKIAAVLFDKDGTLIDVNATWIPIYRKVLMDLFGTDEDGAEALMEKAGFDKATNRFTAGSILAGGTTRQLVQTWWPGLDEAGIAEKAHVLDHGYTQVVRENLMPLMPLEPILSELRAMGLKLGVATNDSHVSAKAHMTHIGVIEHFDDIIAADTVAVPKPSGNMIRRFAEITGLPAASIAMVGDNHHDMEEARNGGAGLAIAVLSGNASHDDIAHLADYTIASVADLPALLGVSRMFYDAVKNDHGLPNDPFKAIVAPRPIGWVSTMSASGIANLAPYSFFNAVSENPHYVVFGSGASGRLKDSQTNIEATGEFAFNLATFDLREQMNASSATVAPDVDEFELSGLTKAPCRLIKPPRVAESPVGLECRLFRIIHLPDDSGSGDYHLIIGRVIGIHIDDRFIKDGRVDTAAMQPIARLGYSEYATVTEAWRMRRPA